MLFIDCSIIVGSIDAKGNLQIIDKLHPEIAVKHDMKDILTTFRTTC